MWVCAVPLLGPAIEQQQKHYLANKHYALLRRKALFKRGSLFTRLLPCVLWIGRHLITMSLCFSSHFGPRTQTQTLTHMLAELTNYRQKALAATCKVKIYECPFDCPVSLQHSFPGFGGGVSRWLWASPAFQLVNAQIAHFLWLRWFILAQNLPIAWQPTFGVVLSAPAIRPFKSGKNCYFWASKQCQLIFTKMTTQTRETLAEALLVSQCQWSTVDNCGSGSGAHQPGW